MIITLSKINLGPTKNVPVLQMKFFFENIFQDVLNEFVEIEFSFWDAFTFSDYYMNPTESGEAKLVSSKEIFFIVKSRKRCH